MKRWIRSIFCVGILTSGTVVINEMPIQASEYEIRPEIEEEDYTFLTVVSFNKECINTGGVSISDINKTTPLSYDLEFEDPEHGLVKANITLSGLMRRAIINNLGNWDELSDYTVKISVKRTAAGTFKRGLALFSDENGKGKGGGEFTYKWE